MHTITLVTVEVPKGLNEKEELAKKNQIQSLIQLAAHRASCAPESKDDMARMKYIAQHKGKKRFSLSDPLQDEKADEIYPTVYLGLEDGTVLSVTAVTGEYPSIDVNLIRPGDSQDEKVAFVEWNNDRESGRELCVGCYRHIGDEPAYYQSYNDEKEQSNDIDYQ